MELNDLPLPKLEKEKKNGESRVHGGGEDGVGGGEHLMDRSGMLLHHHHREMTPLAPETREGESDLESLRSEYQRLQIFLEKNLMLLQNYPPLLPYHKIAHRIFE
ncbi:Uncharacterized protein Fot_20077 [Forsythia ovata]|uniref:Uncharacterized protein n=1 Tax=Forsythia ovata TaxID=205694 RepID=A0ABD1VN40_9LAMI